MLWGQEGMRGHTVVYRMCFSGEEADKASNGGNANTCLLYTSDAADE